MGGGSSGRRQRSRPAHSSRQNPRRRSIAVVGAGWIAPGLLCRERWCAGGLGDGGRSGSAAPGRSARPGLACRRHAGLVARRPPDCDCRSAAGRPCLQRQSASQSGGAAAAVHRGVPPADRRRAAAGGFGHAIDRAAEAAGGPVHRRVRSRVGDLAPPLLRGRAWRAGVGGVERQVSRGGRRGEGRGDSSRRWWTRWSGSSR